MVDSISLAPASNDFFNLIYRKFDFSCQVNRNFREENDELYFDNFYSFYWSHICFDYYAKKE